MNLTKTEKKQYNLIIVSLYLFIFSYFFSNQLNISFFNYIDDITWIFLLCIYLSESIKNGKIKIYTNLFKYFIVILIFVVSGLISNEIYKIQPINAVFLDIIANVKFFFTLGIYYVMFLRLDLNKLKNRLVFNIRLITISILFLSILDYLFHIFSSKTRWGIPILTLFYGHSTTFGDICIFLMIIILFFKNNIKEYRIYIVGLTICSIATIRFKIITSVFIIYMIYIFVMKLKKKITISKILTMSIIGIVIAFKQIEFYFFMPGNLSARNALLVSSFKIMKDYFPIGTGFATFASSASEKFYSDVYYKYNLYTVYGLHGDNTSFISDIFWPSIIGQFGIIGIILYIIMLIFLLHSIQKIYNDNLEAYFAAISIYFYMIISTLSTSAFLSASGVMFAFWLALMLAYKKVKVNI